MIGAWRRTGFTMLEMILVLAILGILGGVIAPSLLGSVATQEIEGSARLMVSDLHWLRSEAIKATTRHRLLLAGDRSGYSLQIETAPSTWSELSARALPKSVRWDSATFAGGAMVYTIQGAPADGAGSATLTGTGTRKVTVEVFPGSGLARWVWVAR